MARDEAGQLIDPFGGAADLERGLLRHVSAAFVEDPVRILRVARFAARFGFAVAPETMALMRSMVANGEADALVPERVWQEFSKGLMESNAALMFPVLAGAGLLEKLLPELKLAFEHGRPANDPARVLVRSLECAAAERLGLAPRFALVAFGALTAQATRALNERFKAPGDCRDLALLARRHGETIKRAPTLGAPDLLALLEHCDALRRPERFDELLALLACVERGERGWTEIPYMPRVFPGHRRIRGAHRGARGDPARARGLPSCRETVSGSAARSGVCGGARRDGPRLRSRGSRGPGGDALGSDRTRRGGCVLGVHRLGLRRAPARPVRSHGLARSSLGARVRPVRGAPCDPRHGFPAHRALGRGPGRPRRSRASAVDAGGSVPPAGSPAR